MIIGAVAHPDLVYDGTTGINQRQPAIIVDAGGENLILAADARVGIDGGEQVMLAGL